MKFKFFILLFLVSILSLNSISACEIGERTYTQYCDINGEWQDQNPDGNSCENNFECESNLCENNICTSENIVEKLMKQKYLLNQILALLTGQEPEENGAATPSTGTPSTGGASDAGDSYTAETTFSTINPNRLYTFNMNELPLPVTGISFILNTALTNVKIIIKRMIGLDSNIPEPEGTVYMYFHIDPDGIKDEYIHTANIVFRVDKEWLEDNNVPKYKIVLQRYTTKWNIIKPQIIAEDDTFFFYNALTPGFSWFAVTSSPPKPKYTPIIEPMCGNEIIEMGETCKSCPEDVFCAEDETCYEGRCIIKKKTPLIWFITPAIIIILLAVLWFIFKKYKKSTTKELKPIYKQIRKLSPPRRPIPYRRPISRPIRRQSLKR